MSNIQKRNEYLKKFRAAFNAGVDGIVRAAEIYAEAVSDNPNL